MGNATQTAAAQQKQQTQVTKKEGDDFWDNFYKGAMGVAGIARGVGTLADTVGDAYKLYDNWQSNSAYEDVMRVGTEAAASDPSMQTRRHADAMSRVNKAQLEQTQVQDELAMRKIMDEYATTIGPDRNLDKLMSHPAYNTRLGRKALGMMMAEQLGVDLQGIKIRQAQADIQLKEAQTQKALRGGSGDGGIGPKHQLHRNITAAGYIWDEKAKGYFRSAQDDSGKWQPNYSKPLTDDALQHIALKAKGKPTDSKTPPHSPQGTNQPPAGPPLMRGAPQQPPAGRPQAARPMRGLGWGTGGWDAGGDDEDPNARTRAFIERYWP
jgi:hypothetical protein